MLQAHCLHASAALVFVLAGCSSSGGDAASDAGASPEDAAAGSDAAGRPPGPADAGVAPNEPAQRVAVSVELPAGVDLDVEDTRIWAALSTSDVSADGSSEVPLVAGTRTTAYLLDDDGQVVMAAFVDEDHTRIDARSTAEVVLFWALGTLMQPYQAQEAVRAGLSDLAPFEELVEDLANAMASDRNAMSSDDFGARLAQHVAAVYDDLPLVVGRAAALEIDPATERDGLQLSEVDAESFTITNSIRRRAHAFVYKLQSTDRDGATTVVDEEIAGSDTALAEQPIGTTTAIRGFVGVLQDWASGKGMDFAAVTTPPITAPLSESEDEALYAVRAVGPGDPNSRPTLTTAERERLDRLVLETLAFDLVLPIFLDIAGAADGGFEALGANGLQRFADTLGSVLASVAPANDKLLAYDIPGAFQEFLVALTNDVSGAVFEDLSEVVVELVFDRFDERYAFDQRRARFALEEANGVLSAMDASMKIIDYARVYNGAQSSQLTEFEVVAKRGDVNLVPRSAVTIPFVAETFRAHVREELAGDAIFEYEWSTSGLHGTLSDSRGGTGVAFTSSSDTVSYTSNELIEAPATEWIRVEVYRRVLMQPRELVDMAMSTLTLVPNEQVMRPMEPTVQCRSDVRLHLERSDGEITIAPNPSWDYRIDWTIAGEHGRLPGNRTSMTRYDDATMTYGCTDTETLEGVEPISAVAYIKEKDESVWRVLSRAQGEVRINNDPNLEIRHLPLEVFSSEIMRDDPYINWGTFQGVRIAPPPRALRYNARTYGLTAAPEWMYKTIAWEHGAPVVEPLPPELLDDSGVFIDGNYFWVVSSTGCQSGTPEGCNAEHAAGYESTHRAWGGFAEVIIELEPE